MKDGSHLEKSFPQQIGLYEYSASDERLEV